MTQNFERVAKACCLTGDFTLKSGRKSNYYIDKYRLIADPAVMGAIVDRLVDRLPRINRLVIAGQELGGAVLASHIAVKAFTRCILVRKKTKEYGTQNRIERIVKAGDQVFLVEDVATTGGSMIDTAQVLGAAGAEVIEAVAVVDRNEGSREAFAEANIPYSFLYSAVDLAASMGIEPSSTGP